MFFNSTLVSLKDNVLYHILALQIVGCVSITLSCIAFIKTAFVPLLLSDLSILIFSRCLSYCLLMAS